MRNNEEMIQVKTEILNSSNITLHSNFESYKELFHFLEDLQKEYSNFHNWYFKKVFNSILLGERQIIIKKYKSEILGISILKNNLFEKKICTLRVNEKYRGLKIGTELMNHSLDILDDSIPLITVSSKRLSEFSKLLKNFNFELFKKYEAYYFKGLDEYSFNRPLQQESPKKHELILP